MCGICGIVRFDNKGIEEASIRNMMQIMKHRGPDDEGVFFEDKIGLGFVRLSIIDLSPSGHQPMFSLDNRYIIIFNGEIYNYVELCEDLIKEGIKFRTHTDTEVLLNAYIHWGEECLNRFNGMWSFVIYDRKDRRIFAARDRFGIKPFYYLQTEEFFAFASEIPPLLTLIPSKPTPDFQSVFDYLAFNRTDQTDHTFFSEIKKMQHGYKFVISDLDFEGNDLLIPVYTKLKFEKWYDLRERVCLTNGFKDSTEFREIFTSSIGLRLRSDVPVGVCLSGGLDSSCITSVLLKDFIKNDLSTFSAVYCEGQHGDESEYIKEYNTSLSNMFFTTPDANSLLCDLSQYIRAQAEPVPTTSPYAQFKVMKLAQGKVVVTLDGQGADEELAGYHYFFGFYFKDLLLHGKMFKLFYEILIYLVRHKKLIGIKSFIFFMLPKKIRTKVRINKMKYINEDFANKYKDTNNITGNIYGSDSLTDALLDHFEFKLEHLLKWEDRNSMWFSIEARVPFLDYRLVEKILASPSESKISDGMTKHILRIAMKGTIPEKIRIRKDKIGFGTPESEWFRSTDWIKTVGEILQSESFKNRNIINVTVAQNLFQRHLERKVDLSREVWKWIHLEMWFREFID